MQFYPQNPRRGAPPIYGQNYGPPTPNQFSRQDAPFYYPNQFARPNDSVYYSNQFYPVQQQPYLNPYQQPQASRFGRLPGTINTIMGHAGTITSGINMMRQFGAIMRLFR